MIEIILEDEITMPSVDVDYDTITGLIERTAEKVLSHANVSARATVLLTDNEGIRDINRDQRNIDSATDVLSFPAMEGFLQNAAEFGAVKDCFLGDIAISLERAYEQSVSYGHSFLRELAFLTAHGMLHLLGYDHMTPEDESEMFAIQKEILLEMGLSR